MSRDEDIKGPYIVWLDYGYEGWKPESYPDLASALTSPKYGNDWEITKKVIFKINDDGSVTVS
jgi:hypothetical protein